MKKISIILIAIITVLGACRSTKNLTPQKKEMKDLKAYLKENKIKTKPTKSSLYYIETKEGNGPQAKAGDVVRVHYTGKLLNGKVFDSSYDKGEPIEFKLGTGNVIKGWDEGIAKMKVGGKATLIIPSKLGYGSREIPNVIPAYSTLVFEVELVEIK